LNELVAALQGASNRLINVEEMSEDDEAVLKRHYNKLVELARSDSKLTECHSIEEATHRHQAKSGRRSTRKNREKARNSEKSAADRPKSAKERKGGRG
jgi:hypothetical protein